MVEFYFYAKAIVGCALLGTAITALIVFLIRGRK